MTARGQKEFEARRTNLVRKGVRKDFLIGKKAKGVERKY
jgi:hypothetical protein